MGCRFVRAVLRLTVRVGSMAYAGCVHSAWWRFRLPFVAVVLSAGAYVAFSLGINPTPVSSRLRCARLVVCRTDGAVRLPLDAPVQFDRISIAGADSLAVVSSNSTRMLRMASSDADAVNLVAGMVPITAYIGLGQVTNAAMPAWVTSDDTIVITHTLNRNAAMWRPESGRWLPHDRAPPESVHFRLRPFATPVRLVLTIRPYGGTVGVLSHKRDTIVLETGLGDSVSLIAFGQYRLECAGVGSRVVLQDQPGAEFVVDSRKSATVCADVDSGELVLHSSVRQQPYELVPPTSILAVGDLQAVVVVTDSESVIVKVAGVANSILKSGGSVDPLIAKVIRDGVQLLPRKIEAQRDIVLSISAIAFLVVNLLSFFWMVFKRDEHGKAQQ